MDQCGILIHLVCWVIPIGLNVYLYMSNRLGNSKDLDTGGWCWIHVHSGERHHVYVVGNQCSEL